MVIGRKPLGMMLVEQGVITSKQLTQALENQRDMRMHLGKVLVDLGFLHESEVLITLSRQLEIPFLDLTVTKVSGEFIEFINPRLARHYNIFPLEVTEGKLTIATNDPLNILALDDVKSATGMVVEPVICGQEEIEKLINRYYSEGESLVQMVNHAHEQLGMVREETNYEATPSLPDDSPVVRLVNSIILNAVQDRASDIHVEPRARDLRVRCRIDGLLVEMMQFPKAMQGNILTRIKVMAGLNIAQRRLPQDGRIKLPIGGREVDFRVSTLPTVYGEKAVLRILDRSKSIRDLDDLGLSVENQEALKKAITAPNGLILVTGPTGSGKTTTLYALLKELNCPTKNIITLEDPVEYTLPGISQVQLNGQVGLTFAGGLRSVLRQDPDIIMVGEIRDKETAKIAIQSAMTGHLVLSTLHTNGATSVPNRLMDMGIEPYLVASALVAVVGQRLVRVLCPHCSQNHQPIGCSRCNQIGYKGRHALQEVLPISRRTRELINAMATVEDLEKSTRQEGFIPLIQDGLHKVAQGITTKAEVFTAVNTEGIKTDEGRGC